MSLGHGPKIVMDGLVLYLDAANPRSYPGTGTTWSDLSGNGNDVTLVNGVGFDSNNNGSMTFDGAGDYAQVELPNPVKINNTTSVDSSFEWTIQTYFTTNATYTGASNPRHTLFSFLNQDYGGQGYFNLSLEIWGNSFYTMFNGNGTNFQEGTVDSTANNTYGNIQSDTFRFITLTINQNNIKVFQNADILLFNRTSIYSMSSQFLRLATRNSNSLYGNISLFNIYNRVLSDAEIQQNYNATKSRYGI